jgi:hypothetical protein
MFIILAGILGIAHFLEPKTHYILRLDLSVFKWNRERQIATLMVQF